MKRSTRLKKFKIENSDIQLEETSSGFAYCESVGRKAALLGYQAGVFEVWIYPFKIVSDLRFSVFLPHRNTWLSGEKMFFRAIVRPELTTLIFTQELFFIQIHLLTPLNEAGALLLFDVDTFTELELWIQFVPNLIPMWPAGLGGQYTLWLEELPAYFIGEGSKKYVGLIGSPEAKKMSSTPGHQLPADPLKFMVKINPQAAKEKFFPLCISGSIEGKDRAVEIYDKLLSSAHRFYQEKRQHFVSLPREMMSIKTPVAQLDLAYEWAKAALDKGMVENSQVGTGLVAGYGVSGNTYRPGFGWFFGGDACFNSLAMCCYGDFENVKITLNLLKKYQRADGKIPHEIAQSAALIKWFEDYPYGYYHAETTAYFIIAVHDYWQSSHDIAFIQANWDSIQKAYDYGCSADEDGDGLMENSAAGLGAMEVGKLLQHTQVDIYLAALWLQAIHCFGELCELMNDDKLKQTCEEHLTKAKHSFLNIFVDEKKRRLNFALFTDGKIYPKTTVWQAMPLFFELIESEKISQTLREFASAEMSADWGVRSVSAKNENYDPINYNNGSVWPFCTGLVAVAEYKNFRATNGWFNLMANAKMTFLPAAGYQTELLSGEYYRPLATSVPHQLFSATGIILPLVKGLFGLEGNAGLRRIKCTPQVPADWQDFSIANFRCGQSRFDFKFYRNQTRSQLRITNSGDLPYRFRFSPAFGLGTTITQVLVNGKNEVFSVQQKRWCVLCAIETEITTELEIEIHYAMGIEFILPLPENRVGAPSAGLKLLDFELKNKIFKLIVEGLSGNAYAIPVQTRFHFGKINGGIIQPIDSLKSLLKINFQKSSSAKYLRKEITLHIKD